MKKIIFVLMIGLLLIAACNNDEGPSSGETYIGGNEGLKLEFAPDAPPATTADNQQQSFDLVVQILNKGEKFVDSTDANVTFYGFPPEAFGKTKGDLTISPDENIERRIKNPDGTIIEPPFVEAIVSELEYQNSEPGNQEFPIRAEICYLYETNVATNLCILENLLQKDDDDLCVINSNRDFSSSGAPVQITKIAQTGAGRDKTRFTFTIANVDTGKVYKESSGCVDTSSIENKVWVEIQELQGTGKASNIKCTGLQGGTDSSGHVTLTSGTPRDVSCTATFEESSRTDRIQPFNIRLSYDYSEFIETNIMVQYTPEE